MGLVVLQCLATINPAHNPNSKASSKIWRCFWVCVVRFFTYYIEHNFQKTNMLKCNPIVHTQRYEKKPISNQITLLRVIPTMTCQSFDFMPPGRACCHGREFCGARFCSWGFGIAILVLGSSRRGVTRVSRWHPKVLPCDHLPRKMPERHTHSEVIIYI